MQEERPNDAHTPADPTPGFPIVGIGASAGGLAAIEALLSAMPDDAGLALVFVQHLAPDRHSLLVELITRCTSMPVQQITDGMRVAPNTVYVIPPDRDLELVEGALRLAPPRSPRGLRLPIDVFFRSLAHQEQDRAVAIILSGSGSDGTLGIRAIKGVGGMVMAQEPGSAEYSGMPTSAIASGLVDFVAPATEIAPKLAAYVEHSFGSLGHDKAPRPSADALQQALALMRQRTGHDFTGYKNNTITRRMGRRMAIQQITQPAKYVQFLRDHPDESDALFRDLLIGVTSFFRDPEVFSTLETDLIPKVVAQVAEGGSLRVWVAGCSTGEEAYSIAMLLQEQVEASVRPLQVQIFATDIDRVAIERARAGIYPASIAADVSSSRLQRFFVWDEAGQRYRVSKTIRDLIVFSEQNLVSDPPFSQLDLVVCRNVLIYLGAELQERVISLFHYGLRPQGTLLLGTSETVGESKSVFSTIDRTHKAFRRNDRGRPRHRFQATGAGARGTDRAHRPAAAQKVVSFRRLTEETLLRRYAQVGILVNARGDIFYIYGRSGNYLEPASGSATMNILSMAREGLRRDLNTALHRAVSSNESVSRNNVRVKTNGHHVLVNLTVTPTVSEAEVQTTENAFLVTIEQTEDAAAPAPSAERGTTSQADARVVELENELSTKEDYLQTTLEEMETSNEELRSTNEELQSVNEELQSTNEELETSKEELQSVNEELATVNAELQARVQELSRATNDMINLLAGTGVGTVFVDMGLQITRFTPAATEVINLIQTDVGRPLAHIVPNFSTDVDLTAYISEVLDTLVPKEVEVHTRADLWFLMNVRPYRTQDNVIEGAVITFVDVTSRRKTELAMHEAQAMARGIVAFVNDPLLVLDAKLRVVMASAAFYSIFGTTRDTTERRLLYELGNGQWNVAELRTLLEEILPRDESFENFEVNHVFESLGPRKMALSARRFDSGGPSGDLIVLRIQDHRAPSRAPGAP